MALRYASVAICTNIKVYGSKLCILLNIDKLHGPMLAVIQDNPDSMAPG